MYLRSNNSRFANICTTYGRKHFNVIIDFPSIFLSITAINPLQVENISIHLNTGLFIFLIMLRASASNFLRRPVGSTMLRRNTVRLSSSQRPTIIYTETDEAPALATYCLLPVIKTYANKIGVDVTKKNISLAARIIAQFPKYLSEEQRQSDALAELGEICKGPTANIVKLPNISASIPQLNEAIAELRQKVILFFCLFILLVCSMRGRCDCVATCCCV